jgi:hypothetical protein
VGTATVPPSRHPDYTRGMTIALPALAVALAAICVWLGVRVYNRRERWAKWGLGALIAVALVVYPLAWPHWQCLQPRRKPAQWGQPRGYSIYTPMEWLARHEMLPEWYLDYYVKQVGSYIRVRHGPNR